MRLLPDIPCSSAPAHGRPFPFEASMISPKTAVALAATAVVTVSLALVGPSLFAERSSAATPEAYTVTSLGPETDNWSASEPIAVNSHGSVLFYFAGLLVDGHTRRPAEPPSAGPGTGTAGTMINYAVNDNNQVVGELNDTASAAYWSGTDGAAWNAINVAALVPQGQSLVVSRANVIDNEGEIAGYLQYHPAGSTSDGDLVTAGFYLATPTSPIESVPVPAGATGPAVITAMTSGWEVVSAGGTQYRVNRTTGTATVVSTIEPSALSTDGTVLVNGGELHADGTVSGAALSAGSLIPSGISNGDVVLASDTSLKSFDSVGTETDISAQSGHSLFYGVISDNGLVVAISYDSGAANIYLFTPGATVPPPVVNSSGDSPAIAGGVQGCDTGNTVTVNGVSAKEWTLRAAIQAENAGSESAKTITFTLAPTDSTISVASVLPALTAAGVTIQGDGGTATALVLNGRALTGSSVGIELSGANETVTGLSFSWWNTAIVIDSAAGGDTVTADRIGVTANGGSDTAVANGVEIDNSPNSVVGGSTASAGNVVANLTQNAVAVLGPAAGGARIQDNLIGISPDGQFAQGVGEGVSVIDASSVSITGNTVVASPSAALGISVGGINSVVSGIVVQGNTVGLVAGGTAAQTDTNRAAFTAGIEIGGRVSGALIGGSASGQGNVVAASSVADIVVTGTSVSGVSVLGNRIGTNATGTQIERYGQTNAVGVAVAGATTTTIGSSGSGANTIVGHGNGEVIIQPAASLMKTGNSVIGYPALTTFPGTDKTNTGVMSTLVAGNRIGTFADGDSVPETLGLTGILDAGSGDTVGPGNLVDWEDDGIAISGANDTVEGNLVGVAGTGLSALPNSTGVFVEPSAIGTRVGVPGTTANTISGNFNGLVVAAPATVQNNLFGTTNLGNAVIAPYGGTVPADVAGRASYGPALVVVAPTGAGSTIGGTQPGFGNVISGSSGLGLAIDGHGGSSAAARTVVQGNTIGLGVDRTTVIPNTGDGVAIDAPGTLVGALPTNAGDSSVAGGNLVENSATGVDVFPTTTGVIIASNSIAHNDPLLPGKGIVLQSGANAGVAAPVLSAAVQDGAGSTSVTVTASSSQVGDLVQVFVASNCTAGTSGQGRTLLGGADVNEAGDLTLTVPLQAVGTQLTATATSLAQGTSTFADCLSVAAAPPGAPITPPSAGTTASISGTTVTPGSTETVIGTGFAPGEQVQATLHSTPIDLGIFNATSQGTVVVTFTVPKDLPAGLHHVILTGLTSGHTATVAFTVTAAVPPVLGYTGDTVDPASGIIGMSIVLLGLVLVMGVRARKRLQRRRAA
jgi:hypothetical protein